MYLVTGGAGFIGSNIAQNLVESGAKVRVLDNFSSGKRSNLSAILSDIELIEGDLRDSEVVAKAVSGVRFILHQGALPSVPVSVHDPVGTNDANVTGTLNVLEAARAAKVERVVFAASCAIYGDDPTLPKVETMEPMPLSPYALQKLIGEQYCALYTNLFGLDAVSLRYFNVFGRRQDPNSLYSAVIPKFLDVVLNGGRPTIFGDGEQTRDFIFVDDVVRANLAALKAPNAPGKVFNIGSGRRLSINDIVRQMSRTLSRPIDPVFEPSREGDVRHSVANVDLADSILGFKATTHFEQALGAYVRWRISAEPE